MEQWQAVKEQVTRAMASLTTWQKVSLAAIGIVTLGGLFWLITSASQPTYRTLFSDLPEATAQEITEELEAKGIPYRRDSSTSLSVPQDRLYEARMHIAGTGLTSGGGQGYELFDQADFGMTSFTQKVNYQRAKENELARTIRHLETVREVRVHLVMPEESLFRNEQREPSASVVLTLERGRVPDAGQIQSIQHLVASAVDGLTFQQVTVVDSTGRLLARPQDEGIGGLGGSDAVSLTRELESDLEERITRLLLPLVGPESLETIVRIELDTSQTVETSEEYDPDRVAVRSEQRTEDTSRRADPAAIGGAGVVNNLPDRPGAGEPDTNLQETARTSEVVNYEINKIVRQTTHQGFGIHRISVAVLIDEELMTPPAAEGGDGAIAEARVAQQESIERLVKSAVGFSADRGDIVEVSYGAFRAVEVPEITPEPWYMRPDLWAVSGRFLFYSLLAVLLFAFVVRPTTRMLTASQAPDDERQVVGKTVAELEAEYEPLGLEAEEAVDVGLPYGRLRSEILELTADDLDRTGRILRQWIRSS